MCSKNQKTKDYFKQDEERIRRYFRCRSVINSCETTEQLIIAFRYCMFYLQQVHYPETPETKISINDEIRRFCDLISNRHRDIIFDKFIKTPSTDFKIQNEWRLIYNVRFKVDYIPAID